MQNSLKRFALVKTTPFEILFESEKLTFMILLYTYRLYKSPKEIVVNLYLGFMLVFSNFCCSEKTINVVTRFRYSIVLEI